MDTGAQNETWAYKIVDAFTALGIDYFCCAPGSRSTSLELAIASHPKATHVVHFDERGICFHAVGFGKAAKKPAVVVATSGTAIGNLLPGVMEACNERVPLILLSADRPPELRDCGANQTCDQVKLFNNFVRWQVDLPCPDDRISDRYLASTISHAIVMTTYPPAGPVQINCMFREPLFSNIIEHCPIGHHVSFEHSILHPSKEAISYWTEALSSKRKGVIIAGSCSTDIRDAVFALAERLRWPIFADILSSLRTAEGPPSLITHFDPILKLKDEIAADAVIQFGDRFVSKTLSQWLEKQNLEFFLHISDHPMRQDPNHLMTHRVQSCPKIFVREMLFSLTEEYAAKSFAIGSEEDWQADWHHWDKSCQQILQDFFSAQIWLSEPGIVWEIASFLSEEWCLFVGTSMPVRDANQFFLPDSQCGTIFGNRGVSGIDGIIATACGIAKGMGKPVLVLIGDLTFLHDLTSLALLAKMEKPVILCVVNNGGGGIFSFLPISKRKEAFEEFIVASHKTTFASAASLFNIPYFHPEARAELGDLLFRQKKQPHSCIIELTTDRAENVQIHEQIIRSIGTCLNSANSPAGIPVNLH
jgi:2-succinyl-5-enolpyruvyl-6-hydroxy-3-cyclohexene-1-carboxylate synthase